MLNLSFLIINTQLICSQPVVNLWNPTCGILPNLFPSFVKKKNPYFVHFFPHPYKESGCLLFCSAVPKYSCPVLFLHTPLGFFPLIQLLQQDMHQHFLFVFSHQVWLKPSFTYHFHRKSPPGSSQDDATTIWVRSSPFGLYYAAAWRVWMCKCVSTRAQTHAHRMYLPPGRSWLRSECSNIAIGIPTFLERPATSTFFPTVLIPAQHMFTKGWTSCLRYNEKCATCSFNSRRSKQ